MSITLGRGVRLPAEAVTYTHGILAMRGAGKSNAGVVMAEELYEAGMPWVAIDPKGDWWGIRSAGDGSTEGLPIPIFGGIHGDIPLEASAGRLMADLIIEQQMTCVLDTSEFSKTEQTRFLADFAERLFRGKARNPFPLHVFCEEADDYIPQRVFKEQARTVGAFSKMVKQGRSRGLGVTLITQRSAVLNKDVLTQLDTLIVLRTTAPQDRKAVLAWVEHHAVGKELVDSLPELENGEAWIWSPYAYKLMEQFKFRRRATFDSGATPTVGKSRRQKPTTLADVDMASIKEQMTDTIERAKAEDPKELRKRIKELERQLAEPVNTQPVEIRVEVPVTPKWVEVLIARLNSGAQAIVDEANALINEAALAGEQTMKEDERAQQDAVAPAPPPRRRRQPVRGTTAAPTVSDDEVKLKAGARRMLLELARFSPGVLSRVQLGSLAGVKHNSGTFSDYLSTLRRAGFIEDTANGHLLITSVGISQISGPIPPPPTTTDEIVSLWQSKLKAGARRMLDTVVEHRTISRADLGHLAEIAPTSGTFSDYLSTLKRNGLVRVDGSEISLGEAFEVVM